jgi:hypothetical protein
MYNQQTIVPHYRKRKTTEGQLKALPSQDLHQCFLLWRKEARFRSIFVSFVQLTKIL